MNIQKMMKQAQAMQSKLAQMQEDLANTEYEGSSGGGAVRVTLTGKFELKKIHIEKSLVDPEETEMLEDLIAAACNDAAHRIDAHSKERMAGVTAGLNLPPGMKLPF